jgi:hypothetical protein
MSRIIVPFILPGFLLLLWLVPGLAATDALVGNWTLDAGKSHVDPAHVLKSETRSYGMSQDNVVTVVVEGVDADGTPETYAATGDVDGKDYPVPDLGSRHDADAIAWTRIDSRTIDEKLKKKGALVREVRHSVSEDGATLTVTESGEDPQGRPIDAMMVYERQ